MRHPIDIRQGAFSAGDERKRQFIAAVTPAVAPAAADPPLLARE
jgi:hypothetical protein